MHSQFDHYLLPENSFQRLWDEYQQYGGLSVAFDFDDTVFDFHKKGRKYEAVIALLRELKQIQCYLICWTGQQDHNFVAQYLIQNEIPFDAINENPPYYQSTSRKIYANVYLDDRAGLHQVYNELLKIVQLVKLKSA
jgi:hydroxymethylpyrimidine pyrophosphatase-like HAD family hydrolase